MTDITTRLLSMSEAMWMDRSQEEIDALLLEAKGDIEKLRADNTDRKFKLGDRVSKKSGSSWNGRVVGFYSTELTPVGYCVESERETGSVQIYPEAALLPQQKGNADAKQ
ncbi:hypothetical protein ATY75_11940 [Rhizobium sp. N122]|nr:hypothetical protein ATY75_11940 [Rhizobium sp. N122]